MGAFSDLDGKIDRGAEKVKDGAERTKEKFQDWGEDD